MINRSPRLLQSVLHRAWLVSALLCFCNGPAAAGATQETGSTGKATPARIYRSPEERREAGLGRQVTDWLKVSGLAEAELERREHDFSSNISSADSDENSQSIQLGFDLTFGEWFEAELVFEHEIDKKHSELDEGVINIDVEPWGLSFGRLYVPFGEYYSHFVSGPMLEFGETRGTAVTADYTWDDVFEIFAFAVDGEAEKPGSDREIDWGAGFELNTRDEAIKVALSYLSDLADTDELLLEDFDNNWGRQVGAWNAHALIGMDTFEITAEAVKATRSFNEFEDEANRPWAANLEIAWFPRPSFQFALRAEFSGELEDQPERQYGVSAAWRIGQHIGLAADYLYGRFRNDFVFDDNDNEIDSRSQVAVQVSVEF